MSNNDILGTPNWKQSHIYLDNVDEIFIRIRIFAHMRIIRMNRIFLIRMANPSWYNSLISQLQGSYIKVHKGYKTRALIPCQHFPKFMPKRRPALGNCKFNFSQELSLSITGRMHLCPGTTWKKIYR